LKDRMRMPKVNIGGAVMSNTAMIAKATATIVKLLFGIILNCRGITMAKRKTDLIKALSFNRGG